MSKEDNVSMSDAKYDAVLDELSNKTSAWPLMEHIADLAKEYENNPSKKADVALRTARARLRTFLTVGH
jgi:hypothetical protein